MAKFIPIFVCGVSFIACQAAAIPASASSAEGALTRQQAVERADNLFRQFDLNHDGVITKDEAQLAGGRLMMQRAMTGRDVAPGIGGHTLRYLEHAFQGMETVNKQQFEQAMLAHFDEMDLNHDGVVTASERAQAKAQLSSSR